MFVIRRRNKQLVRDDELSTLYGQVFCQYDYLSSVSMFLSIHEFLLTIPLLSTFHHNFFNHPSQKRLITTLVHYDYPSPNTDSITATNDNVNVAGV